LATIASRSGIFFDSSRSTFYFVKDRSLVAWAPLRQVRKPFWSWAHFGTATGQDYYRAGWVGCLWWRSLVDVMKKILSLRPLTPT